MQQNPLGQRYSTNRLKSILAAVDFSDCSKAALAQAVRVANQNGARLHALHVIEPLVVEATAWTQHVAPFDAINLVCRQAHAKLTTWVEEAGGHADVSVIVGTPIHELLTRVRTVSADLLVAGARGSSAPILGAGTLAAKLVRKAPTKVLLVSEGGTAPFLKVVVCVDFSPASTLAVEQVTRVAGRENCEIHCLHVYDPPWRQPHYRLHTPEPSQDFQKEYTDVLQERLERFVAQRDGFNPRCVLFPWSSHGQGIAQYVKEVKADLAILGTRGHTRLRYILLGSTAERLLRELPCSVLTVRPTDA
jgi:nucleotide-binding universal stress UspA family protein